ncbi:AAA family ATPase [Amycolatopsis sp. NPDC005232]|uniref:helix-turn-helix transcriptional regulator n=1 Tax=Amycolatopsis sp. NPDC005232 TaxID=3157027 RepID=UPI0033AF725B
MGDFERAVHAEAREDEFTGRKDEWEALTGALGEWPLQMGLITLSGPPGIGKTRLAARLMAHARMLGHTVATGVADRPTSMTPSGVFASALDKCLRHAQEAVFDGIDETDLPILARLFPILRSRWVPNQPSDPAEEAHAFGLARAVLLRLAAGCGLVVFLDDMQWADQPSIDLLRFLLLDPPPARIVLVLSYRPAQSSDALLEVIAGARRWGVLHEVALGPLAAAEVDRLLPAELDRARRRSLHRDSSGNPAVALELARATSPTTPHGVPPSGEELSTGTPPLVHAQGDDLQQLRGGVRLIAHAAAVCGNPFDVSTVAFVAETTTSIAATALEELVTAAVLELAGHGWFRFRDPVVRAMAYHSASAGWRHDAHSRAALILRSSNASVERQACHLEHVAVPGDIASGRVLVSAAAETMYALPARAQRWLNVAARVFRGAFDSRGRVLLARSMALAGCLTESLAIYEDVWREWELLGQPTRLDAAEGLARVNRLLGRYGKARENIESGLVLASGPGERFGLLIECLATAIGSGGRQGWSRVTELVLTNWSETSDTHTATAFSLLAGASLARGRQEDAVEWARGSAELVDRLADEEVLRSLETLWWLGVAEWRLGQSDDATRHFDRGHRLATEHAHGYLHARFPIALGRSSLGRGDFLLAEQYAEEAVQSALGARNPAMLMEATAFYRELPDHAGQAVGNEMIPLGGESGGLPGVPEPRRSLPLIPDDLGTIEETSALLIASRTLKLLSVREEQVAQLVSRGCTNQQIAREIGLSHKTVETYLGRIFKKLGVSARTQIAYLMGAAASSEGAARVTGHGAPRT